MAYSVTEGRGSEILALSAIMIAFSTIAIGLRFWGRHIAHRGGLWWDDWLSLAALPFVWALCALSIYWVYLGLGQHYIYVSTSRAKLGQVLFGVNHVYNIGLTLIKLSVLMFYARVFRTVRSYRIAIWIVGLMVLAWGIALTFVALFTCTPIRRSWDRRIPGHCLNREANFLGAAVPNILTDFILLVMPMPMLWHVQTTFRRKIGLFGVFAAGYVVLILSIVRFVFIARLGTELDKDLTWNGVNSVMLLVCETSIAFISSCVPSIFNLVKHAATKGYLRLPSWSRRTEEVGEKIDGGMGLATESKQKRWDFRFRRPGGPLASVNISSNRPLMDVN
ncbi:MAG: hypothetical protein Q9199_002616, partial [Rusavskia elegans]